MADWLAIILFLTFLLALIVLIEGDPPDNHYVL